MVWRNTIKKIRLYLIRVLSKGLDSTNNRESDEKDSLLEPRKPGIKCPECGEFIPTTLNTILNQAKITCLNPSCQITLYIDTEKSEEGLQVARKYYSSISKVESGLKESGDDPSIKIEHSYNKNC